MGAALIRPLTSMITRLERTYFDPAVVPCETLHRMARTILTIYGKASESELSQVDELVSQQMERFWSWSHRRIVTVQEACAIFSRSRSTIYRWIKQGRLHAVKEGRRWKIAL